MKFCAVLALLTLTGCAYSMQMMPRDSGQVYAGTISSNGFGSGKLSVQIDGRTCSGNFVQVGSGDSFGFAQTYGRRPSTTLIQMSGGTETYKALLTCTDGMGLRCDASGSTSGGGVCVDSSSRVYDMMYN
jgi:hypothetical protein